MSERIVRMWSCSYWISLILWSWWSYLKPIVVKIIILIIVLKILIITRIGKSMSTRWWRIIATVNILTLFQLDQLISRVIHNSILNLFVGRLSWWLHSIWAPHLMLTTSWGSYFLLLLFYGLELSEGRDWGEGVLVLDDWEVFWGLDLTDWFWVGVVWVWIKDVVFFSWCVI